MNFMSIYANISNNLSGIAFEKFDTYAVTLKNLNSVMKRFK